MRSFTLLESNPGNGDDAYGPFNHKSEAIGRAIGILAERKLSMPEEFESLDLNEAMRELDENEYGEYESAGYGIFSFEIRKMN